MAPLRPTCWDEVPAVASSENGFAAEGPLGGWPRKIVSASLAADDPRGLFQHYPPKAEVRQRSNLACH